MHEQPDLVVDAMLGSQTKLVDLQEERTAYLSICDMIHWTHTKNTAPILSIDYPTGVDASTGNSRSKGFKKRLLFSSITITPRSKPSPNASYSASMDSLFRCTKDRVHLGKSYWGSLHGGLGLPPIVLE